MSRRAKWIIAASLLFASIASVVWLTPREPKYSGRPLGAWLKDLESPDPKVHTAAEEAIKNLGPDGVFYLTSALQQRDSLTMRIYHNEHFPQAWTRKIRQKIQWHRPMSESQNAANALALLGPTATPAIPALVAALCDDSPLVAGAASQALSRIGAPAVPALTEALQKWPRSKTVWVIRAFAGIGPPAAPAAPEIAKFLDAQVPDGDFASLALSQIGPPAAPFVTNLVNHPNHSVRLRAISYVERLGPAGVFATNILFSLVDDADPRIRRAAFVALWSVRPPIEDSRPIWTRKLDDPDPGLAAMALNHLSFDEIGVHAANQKIAALATNQFAPLATSASNILTMFQAWPKK